MHGQNFSARLSRGGQKCYCSAQLPKPEANIVCAQFLDLHPPTVNNDHSLTMQKTGFLASGKIRESQGKIFPSGKTGSFNIFVESQGKSGNFNLAEVNQILSYISRPHLFQRSDCWEPCENLFSWKSNSVWLVGWESRRHCVNPYAPRAPKRASWVIEEVPSCKPVFKFFKSDQN